MESQEPRAAAQPHGPKARSVFNFSRFFCAVVDELFFVFSYPPIQFVYEAINCRVHIFFGVISVDRTTIYVDCSFGLMPEFFHREDTVYVRHKIKMPFDLLNLRFDITSKGFGYLNVMA